LATPAQVSYLGLNVVQTLFELLRVGNEKKATVLKTNLKMADAR
jgi:hypothetical protein